MARKKKILDEDEIEVSVPETQAADVEPEVQAPVLVPARRMAQADWRSWGAPATDAATGEGVTLPPGTPFEVLELAKDTALVRHPVSGAVVRVRRGMLALL
jgi:hypothetical protein